MLPSSIAASSRAPRRFVDRRRDRTRVTRKSAPARIAGLPELTADVLRAPLDATFAAEASATRNPPFTGYNSASRHQQTLKHDNTKRAITFEDSDSSGDESDSSYNSFILSLQKKDLLRLDTQLSLPNSLDRIQPSRSPSPDPNIKYSHGTQPMVYRVLKSHYNGDLFRNSKLNAQLIVGPSKRSGQTEYMRPLFKWVHVENPEMNFGAYLEYVTRCPYLDDAERESVGAILRTAREKSDRSLRMPSGMTGSYIEPEYFEESIESTLYQGPRSQRTRKETVQWIAIPYFYLTQSASSITKAECGLETKHQPFFSKKGCIGEGDFFQVAQFWCLMIGNAFMISCARISITDIPGNLVNLNYIPPADPTRPFTGERAPVLQVSDGGLRLWLLPLDQCETWPAFVANFINFGFSLVDGWQVKYRDMVLGSEDWDTIVTIAKKTVVRLELRRKNTKDINEGEEDGSVSSDNERNTLPEIDRARNSSQSYTNETTQTRLSIPQSPGLVTSLDEPQTSVVPEMLDRPGPTLDAAQTLKVNDFHVFTLLATVPIPVQSSSGVMPQTVSSVSISQQYRIDEQQLQYDLTELDHYLSTRNSRKMESISYRQCPGKTIHEVQRYLSTIDSSDRDVYVNKWTFVRAIREIFEFFFPIEYEHAVTLKFWGSVDQIMRIQDPTHANEKFGSIIRKVTELALILKEIRQDLFSEKQPFDYLTTIPHEFIQAWILFQTFLVCYPMEHPINFSSHLKRCKDRVLQGRLKLVERLQPINIREREAVLPLGLTCLLLGQLLHDSQGPLTPERHRLTSAYWTFLKEFKQQVHSKPLSRKYESKFSTMKSEFETIIGTLEDQQRVLIALQDSINESESHSFAHNLPLKSIRLEPSREASITEYLIHQTEEMLQNFWEMSRRLNELENWHFLCLSIDKDKQDRASLTFTTVTVFFLPLTTLASILGMNTSDIRDMSDGQWVFWAVAIPLCLFSLIVWLFYLRSFEPRKWWQGRRHGKAIRDKDKFKTL